jgi:hypothetical protein
MLRRFSKERVNKLRSASDSDVVHLAPEEPLIEITT